MKRRLRKKKRLGEFTELAFEVRAQLRGELSRADVDAFLDRWLAAVEARRLAFGGAAPNGAFAGLVGLMARGSATEDDRAALAAMLAGDPAVVEHEVLPLRNARS